VLLAENTDGALGMPCGMTVAKGGQLLMANTRSILQIDAATGQIQTFASGGNITIPISVAAGKSGDLFILNAGSPAQIVRLNSQTGAQVVVSRAGYLNNPQAITMFGNSLYLTDMTTAPGTLAVGRILEIDIRTGAQNVLAEGQYLVQPLGIAADENGELVVGDPSVVNEASPDLYDGGIVRINCMTGKQTLVARGNGGHVNPRGVLVVPPTGGHTTKAGPQVAVR
jgi:hypothetical protein